MPRPAQRAFSDREFMSEAIRCRWEVLPIKEYPLPWIFEAMRGYRSILEWVHDDADDQKRTLELFRAFNDTAMVVMFDVRNQPIRVWRVIWNTLY